MTGDLLASLGVGGAVGVVGMVLIYRIAAQDMNRVADRMDRLADEISKLFHNRSV